MTCKSMKFLVLHPAEDRAEFPQITCAAIKLSEGKELDLRPLYWQNLGDTLCYTTSSPSTRTSSFSAWQRLQVAWMQVSESEGRIPHVKFVSSINASMKGIGSKREVNWNKSFITMNKPVTSLKRHEQCLLACTWVTVITLTGYFRMASLPLRKYIL